MECDINKVEIPSYQTVLGIDRNTAYKVYNIQYLVQVLVPFDTNCSYRHSSFRSNSRLSTEATKPNCLRQQSKHDKNMAVVKTVKHIKS